MAKGLNGHGAMHLLGRLDEAVEFIKVRMAETRNEVKEELAAVRAELHDLRSTVEAISRPTLSEQLWKLLSGLSGTQWRWIATALFLLTGAILRLDPVGVMKAAQGFMN
jgi:hypothetical protein